jgi:hypothetical protein
MKFDITPTQEEKLKVFQEAVKTIYGSYGQYDYTFTPSGMGIQIKVFSHLANTWLDLTETELW